MFVLKINTRTFNWNLNSNFCPSSFELTLSVCWLNPHKKVSNDHLQSHPVVVRLYPQMCPPEQLKLQCQWWSSPKMYQWQSHSQCTFCTDTSLMSSVIELILIVILWMPWFPNLLISYNDTDMPISYNYNCQGQVFKYIQNWNSKRKRLHRPSVTQEVKELHPVTPVSVCVCV